MAWDANWTGEGKGKLLKRTLNQLKAALQERLDATGRPLPANITAVDSPDFIFTDWIDAFHTEMTTLITKFMVHTATFINTSAIILNWTVETITAQTDEGSRVAKPTDPLLGRKWYWQQRQMLDLMLWTQELINDDSASSPDTRYVSRHSKTSGNNATYVLAQTAFNAAGFGASGSGFGGFFESRLVGADYSITLDDGKIAFVSNDTIKHTSDVVVMTTSIYDRWFDIGTTTWTDPADYTEVETWQTAFTIAEQTLDTAYTTDYVLEQWRGANETPPDPTTGDYDVTFDTSDVSDVSILIRKFNSTNGFTYK